MQGLSDPEDPAYISAVRQLTKQTVPCLEMSLGCSDHSKLAAARIVDQLVHPTYDRGRPFEKKIWGPDSE